MASVATMPLKEMRSNDAAGSALVVTPVELVAEKVAGMSAIEQHAEWELLQRIPMRLAASVPLPRFKVRDLLALKPGVVVKSEWACSDDVTFKVGDVQLCWSEFEVVEQKMAVRITRLA